MTVFVLIAGMGHGAWCWDFVKDNLAKRGHVVLTPELRGFGEDKTPHAEVALEVWARDVGDLIARQPAPVVLVGHSRGGAVISQVAEYAPHRIAALVFLTAVVVPNGRSVLDALLEVHPNEAERVAMVFSEDGYSVCFAESDIEEFLYNETPRELIDLAKSKIGTEPLAGLTNPVNLSEENFGQARRIYIQCSQDRAIPPHVAQRFRAYYSFDDVIAIDADHSPFFSAPEKLSNLLEELV